MSTARSREKRIQKAPLKSGNVFGKPNLPRPEISENSSPLIAFAFCLCMVYWSSPVDTKAGSTRRYPRGTFLRSGFAFHTSTGSPTFLKKTEPTFSMWKRPATRSAVSGLRRICPSVAELERRAPTFVAGPVAMKVQHSPAAPVPGELVIRQGQPSP